MLIGLPGARAHRPAPRLQPLVPVRGLYQQRPVVVVLPDRDLEHLVRLSRVALDRVSYGRLLQWLGWLVGRHRLS